MEVVVQPGVASVIRVSCLVSEIRGERFIAGRQDDAVGTSALGGLQSDDELQFLCEIVCWHGHHAADIRAAVHPFAPQALNCQPEWTLRDQI